MADNTKKCDIMMVRLPSGEHICVVAPYCKGEDSGSVYTTTGLLGQIVKCITDYTGDVIDMLETAMPIHIARRIMRTVWEYKEDADA